MPEEATERKPLVFEDFTPRERRIYSVGLSHGYTRARNQLTFVQMFGKQTLKKEQDGPCPEGEPRDCQAVPETEQNP